MHTPMKEGCFYEAELLAMGKTEEGDETTDEENWVNGQTSWNIFVTMRNRDGLSDEILDLHFPVQAKQLAQVVYDIIDRTIVICDRQNVEFY